MNGGVEPRRLRVLFVPDSIHWITGTLARQFANFNAWIEPTIVSGAIVEELFSKQPELINEFDLVHFTCPFASLKWLPKFSAVVPCVTSHHHVTDWPAVKHNIDGDAIIVGSREWIDDLRARGVDTAKAICIHYGVDPRRFMPGAIGTRAAVRGRYGIASNAIVVGFFAKFSSNELNRKGVDVFADAIAALEYRINRCVAFIVGPGWADFVALLKSRGVRCVWLAFVPTNEDLAEVYRGLDFYWVTARVEGGPVTLLEAMSTEVCCLTTPVGLAKEIIEDGVNGFIIPFGDAEAFAAKSAELAEDETLRRQIGGNARATILEREDVAITARQVRSAYEMAAVSYKRRSGRMPFDLNSVVAANDSVVGQAPEPTTLLCGLPESIRRRVIMLETLLWAEHLMLYHSETGTALRLILKQWAKNPMSFMPMRVLLRRLLPPSLIAQAISWKKRWVGLLRGESARG